MKIQSVRDLKAEVFETVITPFAAKSSALPTSLALAAGSAGSRPHRSFALGITQRAGEYKLAIRVQRQGLMVSKVLEKIITKAKGEVDVRLVGRVDKRPAAQKANATAMKTWNREDMRPMLIGSSIGHNLVTAGSLGVFVREPGRAPVYVLSNNHVLANENNARPGDVVLQRASLDGGRVGTNDMAVLERFHPIDFTGRNIVDAAIARVTPHDIEPAMLRGIKDETDRQLVGVAPIEEDELVFKIGRTTGATAGRVSAQEVDNIVVSYAFGDAIFDDCVEIQPTDAMPFSDGGDSGSVIVNRAMNGVALLFAGSDSGGANGLGVTYAHPLLTVLQTLGVELAI